VSKIKDYRKQQQISVKREAAVTVNMQMAILRVRRREFKHYKLPLFSRSTISHCSVKDRGRRITGNMDENGK
jgi:hypothetical protein